MDAKSVLKEYWWFDDFRWNQLAWVNILSSWNDLLYVAKTWDWKSLCYQVPALMKDYWVTIVVSPLKSLMQDQVKNLHKKWIKNTTFLNSSLDQDEYKKRFTNLMNWEYAILYVSPEKLESEQFQQHLWELEINYFIVDEFDSINEYGWSWFRPSYMNLWRIRKQLEELTWKRIPVWAFTATATWKMRDEAVDNLKMNSDVEVILWDFIWSNITIDKKKFRSTDEKDNYLLETVKWIQKEFKKEDGWCIIFCTSIKDVKEIYDWLNKKKFSIAMYHWQMADSRRNSAFKKFTSWMVDFIVCTNAFWRWVDKSDIRHVIHYWVPWSVTAYVQEIWRAWRDWERAFAKILYTWKDLNTRRYMVKFKPDQNAEFQKFQNFLNEENECLIVKIREHFWDTKNTEVCWNCCNCRMNKLTKKITW